MALLVVVVVVAAAAVDVAIARRGVPCQAPRPGAWETRTAHSRARGGFCCCCSGRPGCLQLPRVMRPRLGPSHDKQGQNGPGKARARKGQGQGPGPSPDRTTREHGNKMRRSTLSGKIWKTSRYAKLPRFTMVFGAARKACSCPQKQRGLHSSPGRLRTSCGPGPGGREQKNATLLSAWPGTACSRGRAALSPTAPRWTPSRPLRRWPPQPLGGGRPVPPARPRGRPAG